MLRINGLHGIGEYTLEENDVKIEYPDTLALYLLSTSIGVKRAKKSRNI